MFRSTLSLTRSSVPSLRSVGVARPMSSVVDSAKKVAQEVTDKTGGNPLASDTAPGSTKAAPGGAKDELKKPESEHDWPLPNASDHSASELPKEEGGKQ